MLVKSGFLQFRKCIGFVVLLAVLICWSVAAQAEQTSIEKSLSARMSAEILKCFERNAPSFAGMIAKTCAVKSRTACLSPIKNGPLNRFECYDAEIEAWMKVTKTIFTELEGIVEGGTANGETGGETLAALREADKIWHGYKFTDCSFLTLRWGNNMQAKYASYDCVRDEYAKRASIYYEWLIKQQNYMEK